MTKKTRTPFRLDHETVAMANAGSMLALDARAYGATMALGDEPAEQRTERRKAVAVVSIDGPLEQRATEWLCGYSDGYDAIEARFAQALADDDVGAVVLRINSPGGSAAGCFDAVKRMRRAKAAAGKPVYAFADELAASAAYAIATVADEIYLPASGDVGSIGVLMVHAEASRALQNEGIEVSVIRSGKRKADANSFEPLTDAARADLQAAVDELAQQFGELVAEARGGKASQWLALEGATFLGQRAVDAGLADGIATFEEVVAMSIDNQETAATETLASIVKASPQLADLSTDAVAGQIAGWRVAAESVPALQSRVAEFEAAEQERLAAEKAEAEKAEADKRRQLVAKAVTECRLPPAAAFADDEQTKLAPALTEMSTASLEVFLASLPKAGGAVAAKKVETTGAGLTDAEHAYCEKRGLNKEAFAASKARMTGGKNNG